MQSFRLAIVRQHYRPDGGAERIIQRMLDGFGRSLDVSIVTQGWQVPAGSDLQVIPVRKRGWSRGSRFRHFVSDVQAVLQQQRFDLVQSHERVPGCQVYRAGDGVHAEWLRIRAEYQLGALGRWWQGVDPFHRAVLAAERGVFAHPNLRAVICNAEMVRQEILQHYPEVDGSKLHLIRNGVDLDAFTPPRESQKQLERKTLGLPTQQRLALFVGSGFGRKGLDNALDSMRLLPDWSLLVVGKDKQQAHYQRLCQQWGIADRVYFMGVAEDVRPLYRAADVLVHPAWYDPAPNVILESMAMGLPVVTSTTCGNQELVAEGENGFVVPAADTARLTQCLQASRSDDWRHMGIAARQVAEQYPLTAMTTELFNLYAKLLEI